MTPIIQKKEIFNWQILSRKNDKKFNCHHTPAPTPQNKVQSSKYFFQKLISWTCENTFAASEFFKSEKRRVWYNRRYRLAIYHWHFCLLIVKMSKRTSIWAFDHMQLSSYRIHQNCLHSFCTCTVLTYVCLYINGKRDHTVVVIS